MFAIRDDRDYVIEEDFLKAARKLKDAKKLETKLDYAKLWSVFYCNYKKYIIIIK